MYTVAEGVIALSVIRWLISEILFYSKDFQASYRSGTVSNMIIMAARRQVYYILIYLTFLYAKILD